MNIYNGNYSSFLANYYACKEHLLNRKYKNKYRA